MKGHVGNLCSLAKGFLEEANEIGCPARHQELSKGGFWIEEPWISDSGPRSHEFQTSTGKSCQLFEHITPLDREDPEGAPIGVPNLGRECLLRPTRITNSRQCVGGTFVSRTLLRECQGLLDCKKREKARLTTVKQLRVFLEQEN